MLYDLPKTLEINGTEYTIRSDFRAVLDIIAAINDPDLTDQEKTIVIIQILYVDWSNLTDVQEAINKAMWFIDCGEDDKNIKPKPILMNWEQDFKLIVAPINRILGYECRSVDYLHWWTFISAYYEIGECSFSNIISIRSKKKKGKKLEKYEQEFYKDNREMIDLKEQVSSDDQALINDILG